MDFEGVIDEICITKIFPKFTLFIDPNPLVAGQTATFIMTCGEPNAASFLPYCLTGPESTYVPQIDVTLGVAQSHAGRRFRDQRHIRHGDLKSAHPSVSGRKRRDGPSSQPLLEQA